MEGLYKDEPKYRNLLKKWEKEALENFEAKMLDKERPFPCIPATLGYSLNHLRYGFISDPRVDSTITRFAQILKEFTNCSKQFGKYTSLIIFFETPKEMLETFNVLKYEQFFWSQLNKLSDLDGMVWPIHITKNPQNPAWEFYFNGEPYFIYCATPAHKKRKSRQFSHYMLAITPRWVLQEFYKSNMNAKKIKLQIRKRLEFYDLIPLHPDLNTYGQNDNFEWKQYFLRDDNTTPPHCPFQKK